MIEWKKTEFSFCREKFLFPAVKSPVKLNKKRNFGFLKRIFEFLKWKTHMSDHYGFKSIPNWATLAFGCLENAKMPNMQF